MLALWRIQKNSSLLLLLLYSYSMNAVKMDYLPLLLCLRLWFVDPRWSRAEFVLTSSLLMLDSRPKLSYIIQGVFVFSLKHFSVVLYLRLLHDSRSRSVQRRVYDSVLCIFSLIVDSKWHLWDTLIKQFFLLLRPDRYFQQIFSFICIHPSFFFFSGRPWLPFVIHSPK